VQQIDPRFVGSASRSGQPETGTDEQQPDAGARRAGYARVAHEAMLGGRFEQPAAAISDLDVVGREIEHASSVMDN
jgi:hypothetical protein